MAQGGVASEIGMRDTARPVFVHTGGILKRKDTPHRPNDLIKGEVEQGQMVHRLSCLGEISIRIQNHRELEKQDCPQILVWGTNISLDVRTLRNSETVPELVREEVQRSFVCTEPTSTASSPAVAKVLSAGWDRDIY